ncbi:MAG: class I SAM-dependent RNA methyltransferase [Bacilli bacterium]|nr:class I SAM-dependent RNA methyltransferase [Bacilli bacterium]
MEVKIEKLDHFGRGITHIKNKICFVENALPTESVEIELVKENKKYDEAISKQIKESSPDRVEVTCPYYKECGGCQLLHLDSTKEDEFKTNKVKELIEHIGSLNPNLVEDISSYKRIHYRNKVVFHIKDRKLGFYKERTNDIVEIKVCDLLRSEINNLIPILKDLVKHPDNEIKEIMVRVGNNDTKETSMVSIKGEVKNFINLDEIVDVIILNGIRLTKDNKFTSSINTYKFFVRDKSFFQVNDTVVTKLYDEVLNFCRTHDIKNALDLYCGTGTIGIYISKEVEHVLGIDNSESSILDANENKILNNVDNIEFICSKVEDQIDKITGNYDLIVVDPPRAGLDNKTKEYLKKINPEHIIYISCDPATLARDLKDLNTKYEIKRIKPYNMFPKTYHVECVCVLELK